MNIPSLEILQPGPLTTVQDRGRLGYQHLGVPVSGAVDLCAMRMGNILMGNDPYAACLEITMGKFEARFLQDTVFALTGANKIAFLNKIPLPWWKALRARKGDMLQIAQAALGLRDYLALRGGIDVPQVMGSRSTYIKGRFGGYEGRPLRTGDRLHTGPPKGHYSGRYPKHLIPPYSSQIELRVVMGPQHSAFCEGGLDAFATGTFTVTDRTDRMGCRLSGPYIQHQDKADIISDGLAMGSIQVPGNGQPLILLADRPTTGGYAKIATIAAVDIPLIAQALPGAKVKFKAVTLYEAREFYFHKEFAIRRFQTGEDSWAPWES